MDPVDCSGSAAVHSSGSRRILVPGRSGREERGRGFGPLPLGVPFAKAGVQAAAEVSGAGPEAEAAWQEMKIDRVLDSMTLEEKVNQLFMITPEALTGVGTVIQAGDGTREALAEHPVGGLIYFAQNLKDPDETRTMLENTQEYASARSGFPIFLSVDEEGRPGGKSGKQSFLRRAGDWKYE